MGDDQIVDDEFYQAIREYLENATLVDDFNEPLNTYVDQLRGRGIRDSSIAEYLEAMAHFVRAGIPTFSAKLQALELIDDAASQDGEAARSAVREAVCHALAEINKTRVATHRRTDTRYPREALLKMLTKAKKQRAAMRALCAEKTPDQLRAMLAAVERSKLSATPSPDAGEGSPDAGDVSPDPRDAVQ